MSSQATITGLPPFDILVEILSLCFWLDEAVDLVQYLSKKSRIVYRSAYGKELRRKVQQSRFHPHSFGLPKTLQSVSSVASLGMNHTTTPVAKPAKKCTRIPLSTTGAVSNAIKSIAYAWEAETSVLQRRTDRICMTFVTQEGIYEEQVLILLIRQGDYTPDRSILGDTDKYLEI